MSRFESMKGLWKSNRWFHYNWAIIAGACLAYACDAVSERSYPYVLPNMGSELGLSHGQMGQITAYYFITYAIMALVWGIIADRIGHRKCIIIGQVIVAAGLFCMGFVNSSISGLLCYSMCAAGVAAQFVCTVALVSHWFEETKRGKVIGVMMAIFGIVTLALGFVTPLILGSLSWRWVWWIAVSIPVTSIVFWHFLVPDPSAKDFILRRVEKEGSSVYPREGKNRSQRQKESKLILKDIMMRKTTWNLVSIYFTWALGFGCFMTFGVAYLQEVGWSVMVAARVFAIWGALSIPGPIVWGILADRLNKKNILMIVLMAQAIALYFFLNFGLVSRYAGASIFGFAQPGTAVILASAIGDYYEPTVIGTAWGLLNLTVGIGLALGPAVGGYLADITGTLNTTILFGLGAIALSLILTLILKKPSQDTVEVIYNKRDGDVM